MRFYTEEDTRVFETVQFLFIKTLIEDHVFRIVLNRPEKRNAFTPTMAEEIIFALAFAHYNPMIRCVILSGEGQVFCAGADLNAFHNPEADIVNNRLPKAREDVRLGDAFSQLLKPSIAQVEGPVLAGGFLLICGCTFVVSIKEATYSLPEVKRGIWPMQVMASLLQIIPPRKVLEMSITGKSYTADEAFNSGLVTVISERDAIAEEVNSLARLICSNAPYAIRLGMEAFHNLSDLPDNERHNYLKDQLNKILLSDDAKEGISAFKEKRNPIWTGK